MTKVLVRINLTDTEHWNFLSAFNEAMAARKQADRYHDIIYGKSIAGLDYQKELEKFRYYTKKVELWDERTREGIEELEVIDD